MTRAETAPAGAPAVANAVYSLGSSQLETARLQRQADELAADSRDLLDRIRLRPGHCAIDLGCGPRGLLDLLAERVSPGGRVVGLDSDPAHTALATDFVHGQALDGVELLTGDARHTGLSSGSFDLVVSRTLLINIPQPAEVIAEMARLARPGGWVAAMEYDMEHSLCYPPSRAFDQISEIFLATFGRNGADPQIGRKLPEMFRRAGLADVGVEVRAPVYPAGHGRRTVRPDLVRSMRPRVLEMDLASEAELDQLDTAVRAYLGDPHTLAMSGLLFLTWARKPG